MTGATEPVQPVQPADPQPPENLYAIILRDTDPALIVRTTLTPEDMAEAIAPSGKGKVFAVIAGAAVRVADVLAITTAQAYAESLALGERSRAVASLEAQTLFPLPDAEEEEPEQPAWKARVK